MPEIFSRDCKLKLIEYGSTQQGLESVDEIKDKVLSFLTQIIRK